VVRTAWVYGTSIQAGTNFPAKILALARVRPELQVVDDEFGTPTASADLARGILGLVGLGATGLFHLAGTGVCSRFEMTQEILDAAGLPTRLVTVKRGYFPSTVVRPANSALSSEKAAKLGIVMPPWQASLRTYVQEHLSKAA
jgi:dTDP-4-dehydrorhamnose reductase